MYLPKQSLIFIPKPVLYFRVEDILAVDFHRINPNGKQFDMKISIREEKKEVEFLGIERPELEALVEYFRARQVKVIMEQKEPSKVMAAEDDDESEDEDFQADEESDSDSESAEGELGSEEESESKERRRKKKEKKGEPEGEEVEVEGEGLKRE